MWPALTRRAVNSVVTNTISDSQCRYFSLGSFEATIVSADAVDFLTGTLARDVIHSLGGNDNIPAHNGDDIIGSGVGDDRIARGGATMPPSVVRL
jgi:Ca2+-binding RTX toxin-like protein